MCGLFWGAHKSLAPRARTLLGGLGQATLSSFAVATLLFVLVGEYPKFCDLAKQRRKIVGGVCEVGKDDFSLYFLWRCVIFVVFFFSSAAIARRRLFGWEKETYAIVCALRKWSGHIGLQPVVVCTDQQSLQSWHKEHVDTPSGPAARRARWHETFAKFDLSVVYVPGKDNTVADCLSRWAYPAGKAWMDISSHGDAEETEEAKRIIEMEKAMEQEGVKCFVVMANRTDLAKLRGARVQAIREKPSSNGWWPL